jgi:hypothetical protein
MQRYIQKVLHWLGYVIVLGVISMMVLQRQQDTGYFNWRSTMWADPVGYYIYLPATFIYDFDASALPEKITERTGDGFAIDEQGKIITRYSCGVAILQAPVFLSVHLIAGLTGQEQDGFSGIYHRVSIFAAILYSFLGIVLLWYFLLEYFNKLISGFTILTLFFGTNLLYYTIDATGMSHVYSFFLFALLLIISKVYFKESQEMKRMIYFVLISVVSSLIILVRPTNIAFVGLVFILDCNSWDDLKLRFAQVFSIKNIIILIFSAFLVFLPQLLYWKYASGSYVTDSYKGYGFTNWASPKIIEFLFSTNNGLFTYNPIYFVILFALVFMILKKQKNGIYILGLFVGLIYVFSSWFMFSFGCAFGSRNFVEYTAIFALPLGFLFQESINYSVKFKRILIISTIFLVLINLKLVSAYDKCFLGTDWDFKEYSYFLKQRTTSKEILSSSKDTLNSNKEFSESIKVNLKNTTLVNYRKAEVSFDVEIYTPNTGAIVVCTIVSRDSTINWNGYAIKDSYNFDKLGEKQRIKNHFWLPRYYTTDSEISTYIWNINKDSLQVSNFKIHLE